MTNYDRIVSILKSWHYALCTCDNWDVCIYSTLCSDGDIRRSCYEGSIAECLDTLWTTRDAPKEINLHNSTSIHPYPIKPPLLKVGDRVEILEIAKECGDYDEWDKEKQQMVWKVYTIKRVYDDYNGILYDIDGYNFTHYCVCLAGEEKKPRTLMMTDAEWKEFQEKNNLSD